MALLVLKPRTGPQCTYGLELSDTMGQILLAHPESPVALDSRKHKNHHSADTRKSGRMRRRVKCPPWTGARAPRLDELSVKSALQKLSNSYCAELHPATPFCGLEQASARGESGRKRGRRRAWRSGPRRGNHCQPTRKGAGSRRSWRQSAHPPCKLCFLRSAEKGPCAIVEFCQRGTRARRPKGV